MKFNSFMSLNNMMVSPHWLASEIGSGIMKSGGNAVEAMIASAAVISVVYPHMNSLGGDNFWLISDKEFNVKAIDSSGYSAKKATIEFYNNKGFKTIPTRGALSALTVPGVVSGWEKAFQFSKNKLGGTKTLDELLEPAEFIASNGFASISLFLLVVSVLSGLINNTAVVAIFIPFVIDICQRYHISPSKLLLPLSYAAIFGGTLTLIGTSTNLLVNPSCRLSDKSFSIF